MRNRNEKKDSWLFYAVIVAVLHLIGLCFLYLGSKSSPLLLGMGFICYTLGLKHAFDADHIATIDNTVRKLIQQNKNPIGVGFYFSVGHSSVVFVMAIVTTFSVQWAQREIPQLQEIGGLIGTLVSGTFLVLIGFLNLNILKNLYKAFLKMRHGKYDQDQIESLLLSRGLMGRFFSPLFKLVDESWHVYPLGFLFGLGFDTASEVALLAISASTANNSIPVIGMLSLPILFGAGMSLMDTADGVFMVKTYGWAFAAPIRKVYYNITITAVTVVAALLIGGIELVQILDEKMGFKEGFLSSINNWDLGWLGYLLVALFLLSWIISASIWKFAKIEKRWQSDRM